MGTVVHTVKPEGRGAKCGARSYWGHLLYTTPEPDKVTCRRCKGEVKTAATVAPDQNYVGKVFHRSYGYDMTINEYCLVVRQGAKSLLARPCSVSVENDDGRGQGRAVPAGPNNQPAFRLFIKVKQWGPLPDNRYTYFVGQGEHWRLWDGKPDYHNTWD